MNKQKSMRSLSTYATHIHTHDFSNRFYGKYFVLLICIDVALVPFTSMVAQSITIYAIPNTIIKLGMTIKVFNAMKMG